MEIPSGPEVKNTPTEASVAKDVVISLRKASDSPETAPTPYRVKTIKTNGSTSATIAIVDKSNSEEDPERLDVTMGRTATGLRLTSQDLRPVHPKQQFRVDRQQQAERIQRGIQIATAGVEVDNPDIEFSDPVIINPEYFAAAADFLTHTFPPCIADALSDHLQRLRVQMNSPENQKKLRNQALVKEYEEEISMLRERFDEKGSRPLVFSRITHPVLNRFASVFPYSMSDVSVDSLRIPNPDSTTLKAAASNENPRGDIHISPSRADAEFYEVTPFINDAPQEVTAQSIPDAANPDAIHVQTFQVQAGVVLSETLPEHAEHTTIYFTYDPKQELGRQGIVVAVPDKPAIFVPYGSPRYPHFLRPEARHPAP